ncbi:helix-turn-helix transcriptional regulator [Nocardioides sp. WG-D5]
MADNLLGDFLRARRAQVTPAAAGIPDFGRRRVPGLRREEVATQAGMSVDYYVRLEQGRERSPSAQVLEALAQVLILDEDARLHLFQLAGVAPGARRTTPTERVDPELRRLLDMWPDNPAIVLGRGYDLLAGNALAYALFGGFEHGANLVVKIFLDPGGRSLYPDWEHVAAYTVAGLRMAYGEDPTEPRINEVVDMMLARSPDFARLWERHEARRKRMESKRFRHPEVGEMTLWMNAFDVKSSPGQELIVYHAKPATQCADALRLLGTLAATRRTAEESRS